MNGDLATEKYVDNKISDLKNQLMQSFQSSKGVFFGTASAETNENITKKYTKGETVTLITPSWSVDGYELSGWNSKADGSGTSYSLGSSIVADTDKTFYAQWKATGEDTGGVSVLLFTRANPVGGGDLSAIDTNGENVTYSKYLESLDYTLSIPFRRYEYGDSAILSILSVDPTYVFVGWTTTGEDNDIFNTNTSVLVALTGDVVGTDSTLSSYTGDSSMLFCKVTANFNRNNLRYFSIKQQDGGTITADKQDGIYDLNTQITLTATPSDGSSFVRWWDNNTDNPRTFNLTSDAVVKATFDICYTLTLSSYE